MKTCSRGWLSSPCSEHNNFPGLSSIHTSNPAFGVSCYRNCQPDSQEGKRWLRRALLLFLMNRKQVVPTNRWQKGEGAAGTIYAVDDGNSDEIVTCASRYRE